MLNTLPHICFTRLWLQPTNVDSDVRTTFSMAATSSQLATPPRQLNALYFLFLFLMITSCCNGAKLFATSTTTLFVHRGDSVVQSSPTRPGVSPVTVRPSAKRRVPPSAPSHKGHSLPIYNRRLLHKSTRPPPPSAHNVGN